MADIELVIKINEETYKKCKWKNNGVVGLEWWERAIANGTPLPKGHGRLIDADELYKQDKEEWLCPNNAPFISTDYAHVFAEIDNAPTIIEADKTESEEV